VIALCYISGCNQGKPKTELNIINKEEFYRGKRKSSKRIGTYHGRN
jgi:hypothetical protein